MDTVQLRFVGRALASGEVCLGVRGDSEARKLAFALPDVAAGQLAYLNVEFSTPTKIPLQRADDGAWVCVLQAPALLESGIFGAQVEIFDGETVVWNSDIFHAVVRDSLSINEDIEPVMLPELLEAEAALQAAIAKTDDILDAVEQEAARETAEAARVTAEQGRVSAEQGRVTAEQGRVTAESARISAEAGRVSAEQSREAAEDAREAAFAKFEADIESGEYNGATFTPNVSAGGMLSWTNDKGLTNPQSVNIKGADGEDGLSVELRLSGEYLQWRPTGGVWQNLIALSEITGPAGADGTDGSDGTDGVDGQSPTITIGTVTQGATASATLTGTYPNYILNLTIPQGEQGESGVYVGTQEPTDSDVKVWINPDGESSPGLPVPGEDDVGKALVVGEDGVYELGEVAGAVDTDTTLSIPGSPADAAATGAAIEAVSPDDESVGAKPWSSLQIIDTLCPPLEVAGNPVQCYPVAGYPMGVTVSWEPRQSGEGDPYPAGGGPNLLDVSKCTTLPNSFGLHVAISGDVVTVGGTATSAISGGVSFLAIISAPDTSLSGKGYKVTAFLTRGSITTIYGLRTEDEVSIAIGINLVVGQVVDIAMRIMVSEDTPSAYAPYENIRPITGMDEVQVTRCGSNMFDFSKVVFSQASVGIGMVSVDYAQKTITIAMNVNNVGYTQSLRDVVGNVPAGTYVLDAETSSVNAQRVIYILDSGKAIAFGTPTLLTDEDLDSTFSWYNNVTNPEPNTISNIRFSVAETDYAPYTGTTATLTLPETIYGGTVDAVTGEGTEEWECLTLDNSDLISMIGGNNFFHTTLETILGPDFPRPIDPISTADFIASNLKSTINVSNGTTGFMFALYSSGIIRFHVDGVTTLEEAKQFVVDNPITIAYRLATPNIISTTPNTVLAISGLNTIYTDADSVTVSGRADPVQTINALNDRIAALEDAATGG